MKGDWPTLPPRIQRLRRQFSAACPPERRQLSPFARYGLVNLEYPTDELAREILAHPPLKLLTPLARRGELEVHRQLAKRQDADVRIKRGLLGGHRTTLRSGARLKVSDSTFVSMR